MNTPVTRSRSLAEASPGVARLAVCGWSNAAAEALAALEHTGAFQGVAIGDRSALALVHARRETHAPCYQQVGEMVRSADYDAILFADPDEVPGSAMAAAARGARLILLAEAMTAAALQAASTAASVHDVPVTLLHPARHDAGLRDLAKLVSTEASPAAFLDVSLEAPIDAPVLLRTAVAHVAALLPEMEATVRASAWADRAMVAEVSDGARYASIRVRHAPSAYIRVAAETAHGTGTLEVRDGMGEVRFTSPAGEHLRFGVEHRDAATGEAQRAAEALTTGHDDRREVEALGLLLDAIERAIATGEPQSSTCCRQPELRVIEGGASRRERGRGPLRLVVS